MRFELSRGDAMLASSRPVLAHLLTSGDQLLFSDEILARIRGMASHCARQLLDAVATENNEIDRERLLAKHSDALVETILSDDAFLLHAHALALEAHWADRLQQRSGLDPVLPPFLQQLAASPVAETAASAIHVLAAQARFVQTQRRMELPLGELPGELFHRVLMALRSCEYLPEQAGQQAEATLRRSFDEGKSRVGQIDRLLTALEGKVSNALAIDNAGLSLFTSALAISTDQDRDVAVMSLGENQLARLALSLRAAGLSQSAVEAQFLLLHPEISLPPGFDGITAARAADLLATPKLAGGY